MSAWRRPVMPLVVVLFALAALAPAHAQFGNPLRKAESQPAKPRLRRRHRSRRGFGDGVTPEQVERLLKALNVRVAPSSDVARAERANKAAEDANQIQLERMMAAAMEKQSACEEAAREKDPRYKEVNKLSDLRNKAQDGRRGGGRQVRGTIRRVERRGRESGEEGVHQRCLHCQG